MTATVHLTDAVLYVIAGIALFGIITWLFFQLTNNK